MPTIAIGFDAERISQDIIDKIRAISPGYDICVGRNEDDFRNNLHEIEIAAASFPRSLFSEMPRLRWFQQWGAGADWLQASPDIKAGDLIITNTSGIHPIQITEHVFAMLLAFARNLPVAYTAQQSQTWHKFGHGDMVELAGKTMLIVGLGAIGERLARVASAFEMRVIGMRRQPEKTVEGIDTMLAPGDLHSVLPAVDVVVLTIPLTQATKNFIGARELELMKDSACLINIGRGGTIDEKALDTALGESKFRGVGLDVFEQEPLPETSPLWQHERVIITPHYAGLSPHYDRRAFKIFLANLERYQRGEALMNVVDKSLGY